MYQKEYTQTGQKARHINSPIDRTLSYKDWLRNENINGFVMDIDAIKWKRVNGELVPCAITELTKTDETHVGIGYLKAIENRYFNYELQGSVIKKLSRMLNVPAFIILFNDSLEWLWIYSFNDGQWNIHTKESWSEYLKTL